jgi:hypothetical protein
MLRCQETVVLTRLVTHTVLAVMLSAAKHLCAPRARSFATLRMTSEGSRQTPRCAEA